MSMHVLTSADNDAPIELLKLAQTPGSIILAHSEKGKTVGALTVLPRPWDTQFFGRSMALASFWGKLTLKSSLELLSQAECIARDQGIQHILMREKSQTAFVSMSALEKSGFSLVDLGVTFVFNKNKFQTLASLDRVSNLITSATQEDIPILQAFGKNLFTHSHFYRDSFFTTEEAERLHGTWIKNLVEGLADTVWVYRIDQTPVGFVSCKVDPQNGRGDIALVGVNSQHAGKGIASALMTTSLNWFLNQGVESVHVKTQAFNEAAIKLYTRSGFELEFIDVSYSKSLV